MYLNSHIYDHFQTIVAHQSKSPSQKSIHQYQNIFYQYRVVSLERFPELKGHMEKIRNANRFGNHPTFQHYMKSRKFTQREEFPTAKTVIIVAYFKPHARIDLTYHGKKYTTMVPSPYYKEIDDSDLLNLISSQILPAGDHRLELTHYIPSKTLATHSGLAKYGRNNISYVPHFGSSITLRTVLTDYEFDSDDWAEIEMLDSCVDCKICQNLCPNQCISNSDFLLDVNRCLPLYNEIHGEIPDWVDPKVHHTIIGCLRCQWNCPANKEIKELINELPALTEEETRAILEGKDSDAAKRAICEKIGLGPLEHFEYHLITMQRNFHLLLEH